MSDTVQVVLIICATVLTLAFLPAALELLFCAVIMLGLFIAIAFMAVVAAITWPFRWVAKKWRAVR